MTAHSRQQHISAAELRRSLPGSNREHEDRVKAGLQWFALHGIPAVPIHTGPRVTPREGGGFDLRSNKGQIGFGDIFACLPPSGRAVIVDCKTGRARLSPEQVRLHKRFERAGALCLAMHSIDDLVSQIPARGSAGAEMDRFRGEG